jgi:hypothetical protein
MKQRKTRIGLIVALAILAVLALAWYDGGEQSIRPITQDVTVPEGR